MLAKTLILKNAKTIYTVLKRTMQLTLLGGGSLVLLRNGDWEQEASREFVTDAGWLSPLLVNWLLPLVTTLGRVSIVLTGLDVLRRGLPADTPQTFCNRFWMAGGSCFIGLSWTQNVSLLIGLSASAGLLNMFSFSDESTSNFSVCSCSFEAADGPSFLEGFVTVLSRWLTKRCASLQISSKFSSSKGLQLGSSPRDGSLLTLSFTWTSMPWEIHFSL